MTLDAFFLINGDMCKLYYLVGKGDGSSKAFESFKRMRGNSFSATLEP